MDRVVNGITIENNEVEMGENQFLSEKHAKVCLCKSIPINDRKRSSDTLLCNGQEYDLATGIV